MEISYDSGMYPREICTWSLGDTNKNFRVALVLMTKKQGKKTIYVWKLKKYIHIMDYSTAKQENKTSINQWQSQKQIEWVKY